MGTIGTRQALPRQIQHAVAAMNKRICAPATTNEEAANLMNAVTSFLAAAKRATPKRLAAPRKEPSVFNGPN